MYISPNTTPAVKARIAVEKRILISAIDELLAQGFKLSIDNGEDKTPKTTDKATLLKAAMETDEDVLDVYRNGAYVGWIKFIYGNDGWDVISDHTVNLEEDGLIKKTLALVNEIADAAGA